MEIEQDKSSDALYRTGYLCIDLPFELKACISDYSQKELGTFIHEYVHFLQNLTTPWGLYETGREYERISYLVEQIKEEHPYLIQAPVEEEYKKSHEDILKIINYGRGSDRDSSGREVYQLKFADAPEFSYKIEDRVCGKHTVHPVYLQFNTERHGRAEILFGAWAIKESMAALIQEKFDPSSPKRHADIPYNVVERFAKDCFPNICGDIDMLIAICYASLFSLSPALEFIDLAKKADANIGMSWQDLLNDYFEKGIKCNGKSYPIDVFYRMMSDKFITILRKFLFTDDLKYIPGVINATQFDEKVSPLLCFTRGKRSIEEIEKIISVVGLPAVIGSKNKGLFPQISGDDESQSEIVQLLGYETLFKYLTSEPPKCPRRQQCMEVNKVLSSCETTPWDRGDDCPMTEVAKLLEIQDKHVIKK